MHWCIAVGVGEADLEPRQLLSAVAAQPLSRGGEADDSNQ